MSSTTDNEQRFAYLLSPEFEIVNTAGKPLTGGWIEVYLHGTRNKYYCFSDFDGTLHPFQIPLDSLGSNIILASPLHAYDVYIYNKFGSLVMSRYNIVPATNSSDAIADIIVIDSPDETIKVVVDGGTNWHLEVNTDLIATASGLDEVSGALLNKKDKQEPVDVSGSVTKTVTNIKQNENGEIEVTYEDIDLPQQVPNVDIISPSGTLDITSTTDTTTNTKTFKIDVHKSNMDYFEGYYGRAHYEDRPSDTAAAFTTYVDQWREYRYQGDFIVNSWQDQDNTTFLLNSGLYLITASIRYKMTDASVKNKEEYIRIATGAFNGLENGTQLKDWSNEAALDENTIQLSFVRSVDDDEDYDNLRGNHTLYFAPYLPYGVNYAEIDHLQIVKLDSIVTYHGGSGPMYRPGYGIEIQDDVISIATGDVITNNYFETVVSSINNEINELTTVVNNVSGDIVNLSESVTNLIGATGDYATKDYVDAAVSGLENYSAGQYISIEDHVISVTGLQPEGDYATVEQLEAVSGDVNNLTEIVNNITNVTGDFATVEYVDNRIATAAGDVYEAGQYISIEDGVIAATGLQPAGNYATEQYVDEAVAAVTGQPISQVQSDWTQQDDTKVDYIKHKPRQVNLVAGDNITIEQDDYDVIISAAAPGDTYSAGQYISIQNNTIAATGLQPAGNYLTPADLNGYATEQYVDDAVAAVTGQPISQVNSDWLATSGVAEILNKPDVFQLIAGDNIDITASGNDLVISASSDVTKAYVDEQIDAATGMIPDISDLATKTEVQTVDAKVDAVSAAIPTLPQEEEVEFEELNLSDYALASAIPDVSDFATNDDVQYVQEQVDQLVAATGYYLQASDLNGYATEQELSDAIDAATGMIPDISNLATKSELAAVEAEIPTLPEEEEVEFEELNLSDYALASAIPDVSNFATKTELQEVDVKVDAVSGKLPTTELGKFTIQNNVSGGPIDVLVPTDQAPDAVLYQIDSVTGYVYATGTSNAIINYYYGETPADFNNSGDVILFTINDAISNINSIMFYYSNSETSFGGPNLSTTSITGDGSYSLQSGTYRVKAQYNQAPGAGYGKYLQIMFNWRNYALSPEQSLEWAQDALSKITFFGVTRPDPTLGTTVNLDRYYLANTETTSTSGYTQCVVAKDTTSKKQTVYLPYSMPSSWKSDIIQAFNYGSNYNQPNSSSYSTKQYRAYKYTSSPTRYQFAYCTDWDIANSVMTFIAYDNSGNAIEKWTLNYSNYSSNVWTTTPISSGSTYTAGSGIDITNDVISIDNTVALKSEVQAVEADVQTVSAAIPVLPSEEEVEFEELDLSDYALASAIPDITQLETDVANLVAATGDYLQSSDLNGYATEAYVDESIAAIPALSGTNGVTVEDHVVSLDNPVNLIAGQNVDITVSGDDVIISAQESELNDYVSYSASSVYLPNANFEIAHDGRAALVEGGTHTTDYTPTWVQYSYNELTFAEPITLLAGDTISFNHAGYPWVYISINGTTVVDEYASGSQYTYTVESDTQVSEIHLEIFDDRDPPNPHRLNTVTITSNAVQRDEYVLVSELTSAIETLPTPVQSDWYVTDTDNLAYIKNKPGDNRFVPPISDALIGRVLTVVNYNTAAWVQPQGSYSAGKGIDISNSTISVDETVITTAATAVNLSKANFEIDNDGQAYKLTNSSTQVTYAITPTSNGGTFDGTIKLNVGDTITITNCPITSEQLYVKLEVRDGLNVASNTGPVTAGSDITLTVERDTDLTGTFDIQVYDLTELQTRSLTDSNCTFNNIVTSREEYVLESDIPVVTGFATVEELQTVSAAIPAEEEVDFEEIDLSNYAMVSAIPVVTGFATEIELQAVSAAIPDTSDMATQTWVGNQGYLTSVPSNYVTDTELTDAVSGLATKTEVTTGLGTKQNTLTGITDVQVVQALPASPVATILYLIPEV